MNSVKFNVPKAFDLSVDWDEVFSDVNEPSEGEHISIPDALVTSLNRYAAVDIEYISKLSGENKKTVISTLGGSGAIYQNPLKWQECYYLGYETADEYLSGNIMTKLKIAREANEKYEGYFERNVAALKHALPVKTRAEDIYVTIGSPWLPSEIIDDFIIHLFGRPSTLYQKDHLKTKHDLLTGSWDIPLKARYDYGKSKMLVNFTYGTRFMGALEIIERTLNQRQTTVYDTHTKRVNGKDKTVRILNETETMLAAEKQKLLIEEFGSWIFSSQTRKKRLEEIYNEKYGYVKARRFSGDFLSLPDLNPKIGLYPYQKNAVARILFSQNTLLAHDVGAGKTFIMVAAGHELRRTGVSRKNLYVVPNNLTGQWEAAYLALYPTSKLLVVTPANFTPKRRQEVIADIKNGDYEAIIIAYSCFDMIPISNKYLLERLAEEKALLDMAGAEAKSNTSALKRRQKATEDAMKKIQATESELQDLGICFEELGINTLFLDEAHNYKNIKIPTKIDTLGVHESGSAKCEAMLAKVHCVQRQNGGRGAIFATGTPITNSVSDVYTMQCYLQHGELELLDLQSFDSWVGMFAEKRTEFEVDIDTSNFRMTTRLSRFFNIPELTTLFSSVTDFHKIDKSNDVPEFDGHTDVIVPKTPEFAKYLENISERADRVRHKQVSRKEDNLLLITTDGRKAALDIRLVKGGAPFSTTTKAYKCAERIADIYFKTMKDKCAQLVFCDTSTPKADFNVYDELKWLLTSMCIPESEIAYVHDADTERRRAALFSDVNSGKIRVIIGSTFKIGMGVNIQERLVAMHHLDVPWRPADMVQREGRILRQGNTCPKVEIYRYITEGSFDAYSWQLLETKQRFIEDILSGFVEDRSAEDIGDTSLDYGEVKALAVGNPLIKERVECANMLSRFKLLMIKDAENRDNLRGELAGIPERKKRQEALILRAEADVEFLLQQEEEISKEKRLEIRDIIAEGIRDGELLTEERVILTYRGFNVVIPAGMQRHDPYVWLRREGKYYLALGEGDRGHIVRIDNFLDGLAEHKKKLVEALGYLKARERAIKAELKRENEYSEKIRYYRDKLEELDKKLGVK